MPKKRKAKSFEWGFIETFDIYGTPMIGFNHQGKTKTQSMTGFLCSLLTFGVIFFFSLPRLFILFQRKSPLLTQIVTPSFYTPDDVTLLGD